MAGLGLALVGAHRRGALAGAAAGTGFVSAVAGAGLAMEEDLARVVSMMVNGAAARVDAGAIG